MMAGKGSRRRPRDNRYCTREQYDENYERIYGKHPLRNGEVQHENENGSVTTIKLGKQ